MRTAHRAVLIVLLILSLVSAAAPAVAAAPSLADQIQAQEQSLQQLQGQMADTRQKLDAARAAFAALQNKVKGLSTQVAQEQSYLSSLESQLSAAQAKLRATEAHLAATDAELSAQQKVVGLRVQALYEFGTVNLIGVLLGSRSFGDLINRFVFVSDILRADLAALQSYRQARTAAQQEQQQAQAQHDQVVHLQAAASDALQVYQARLQEAQTAAGAAHTIEVRYQTEAQAQAAASAQVQQTLNGLQVEYQRANGGFAFIWPVTGPIIITSPFGMRFHPILHIWELHSGIDIAESTGTPIHAAESGVVVQVGYLTGYGNTVVIDHGVVKGQKIATLYAHQSRTAAYVGEKVQQGEVIGYVGMTGWATGPHLHFEVRVNGKPVNPIPWLPPAP
jgi:murein DD-endopeptidase MepM/ murein hydrolase activator NlpD